MIEDVLVYLCVGPAFVMRSSSNLVSIEFYKISHIKHTKLNKCVQNNFSYNTIVWCNALSNLYIEMQNWNDKAKNENSNNNLCDNARVFQSLGSKV